MPARSPHDKEPPSIFHDDWANNMTSRVFLVKTDRPSGSHFHENKANLIIMKTAPAHGDHAFKQTKNLPEISFKQIICPMLTRETNLPLAAIKYVLSKFQFSGFESGDIVDTPYVASMVEVSTVTTKEKRGKSPVKGKKKASKPV
ncbi:hypothetical protein DPMN_158589, partial [Dreissena polymorpha]